MSAPSVQLHSKFATTYDKLFRGIAPDQIDRNGNASAFWADLFLLDIDRRLLSEKLNALSNADCIGHHKPLLNALFAACLRQLHSGQPNDARTSGAAVTLQVYMRCVLSKNLAGWEVMEVFAGDVGASDDVFMEYTTLVDEILGNAVYPISLRHAVLQSCIIFMCGINQLSPGAYFLRRSIYDSIMTMVGTPESDKYTFEAILLLALLANFHKSEAAKLNPYLHRMKDLSDANLMQKIYWSANFAVNTAIKSYQEILPDEPPTMMASVGAFFAAMRPDRALSSTQADTPRELFRRHPLESTVILLPLLELMRANQSFLHFTMLHRPSTSRIPALPSNLLTLSSYMFSHASSSGSVRAMAYAQLAMNLLLSWSEDDGVVRMLVEPQHSDIRLCRQREPMLPYPSAGRSMACALLDCCVLWLRHNLHKRIEVNTYVTCMRVCYRLIWSLQQSTTRIDYNWDDLWSSVLNLLRFLSSKLHTLVASASGISEISQNAVGLLYLALCRSDSFLQSPKAVQGLIYELVRSYLTLKEQKELIGPSSGASLVHPDKLLRPISTILAISEYYQTLITEAKAITARDALEVVAKDIERDGVHGIGGADGIDDPPRYGEDIIGFRFAYTDGMALMP